MLFPYYTFYTAFLQQFTIRSTTSTSTHHTSFTSRLADPNSKFGAIMFLTLGLQRLKIKFHGSCPGGPLLVSSILHSLFLFVWGPGSMPTLTNLRGDTSYTRRRVLAVGAWGFHNNSFPIPPNLRNVIGRQPKIKPRLNV